MKKSVSLKPYNTFGIEAKASYFAEVHSVDELRQLLQQEEVKQLPKLVLGGGSNMLFTRDFDGVVIKMNIGGIEKVREDENHAWIKSGAGVNWHSLVLYAIENGLGGIENLSLIPGTVGAAPMQNIGAYGVEIKDVFDSLEAVETATGKLEVFDNATCKFGYRNSIFKNEVKDCYIIVSVTFRLSKQHVFNTSYGAIATTLEKMGVEQLSIKAISDAVISIRQSKLPDPAKIGNAGSFFKNPEISRAHFDDLKAQYGSLVGYPAAPGMVKVPAGWLIEQCGWKGKVVGNTGAHKDQALVLVNYGNATGEEIKRLSEQIQQSVKEKFGIELHAEVNMI